MAPRTRANDKPGPDKHVVLDDYSIANQPTQPIRDSCDDDLDELDLVQMADSALLKSPLPQPKGFSWSDGDSLGGPPSPKSGVGMAGNIWDQATGGFSSVQSNRSVLPDTVPLTSHALVASFPGIDFSETASTTQRSSPFQTDDARQQLWDLDDGMEDDTGLLEDFSNTNGFLDKSPELTHCSLREDIRRLPSNEIYRATPTKQRSAKAPSSLAKNSTAEHDTVPESSHEIARSGRPAILKQTAEIRKHKPSPAESFGELDDEMDDIAAVLSKRQPTADTAPSSTAKPKVVRKPKQRPKSPLKFDEDTQKIKPPSAKPAPKIPAKPVQKSAGKSATKAIKSATNKKASTKPTAAKRPTRRSTRKKAPATEDKTGATATAQGTTSGSPVVRQPTPNAREEPKPQKASTPKTKPRVVPPESPIVLSSDDGSLYQPSTDLFPSRGLQSPVVQRRPTLDKDSAPIEELLSTAKQADERLHQKNALLKLEHSAESAEAKKLSKKPAAPPHVIAEPTNQNQEIPLDNFQKFQPMRNRTSRAISVSDAGSPFAKLNRGKFSAARLAEGTPQLVDNANVERFDIHRRSKYPSPLFQAAQTQNERRALIDSPDTPNRSARAAAGPPSFVLHETSEKREDIHRKSSDWARILSLNKDAQAKKTEETANDTRLGQADDVGAMRPADRQQPAADSGSKLTQKIYDVAEGMMMHLRDKEASVKEIPAVYQENVVACVEKLVKRYESEEGKLTTGCKRDCELFMEQLKVARDAVEVGRCKRRKVLQDMANKFDQRRADGETELLNVRQLLSEVTDGQFEEKDEENWAKER